MLCQRISLNGLRVFLDGRHPRMSHLFSPTRWANIKRHDSRSFAGMNYQRIGWHGSRSPDRRKNVRHIGGVAGSTVVWSAPDVALQPILGILPKQRPRTSTAHPDRTDLGSTGVNSAPGCRGRRPEPRHPGRNVANAVRTINRYATLLPFWVARLVPSSIVPDSAATFTSSANSVSL